MSLIPDFWYELDSFAERYFALKFQFTRSTFLYKVGAVGLDAEHQLVDGRHVVCQGQHTSMPGIQLDDHLMIVDLQDLEQAGIHHVAFFVFSRHLSALMPVAVQVHSMEGTQKQREFIPSKANFERRRPFWISVLMSYFPATHTWKLLFQNVSYATEDFYSLIGAEGLGGTDFFPRQPAQNTPQSEHPIREPAASRDNTAPEPVVDIVAAPPREAIAHEEPVVIAAPKKEGHASEAVDVTPFTPPEAQVTLWDCEECVVKRLSVDHHQYCPACGHLQTPSGGYSVPVSEAKVNFLDQKVSCAGCLTQNAPAALHCRMCGTALHEARSRKRRRKERRNDVAQKPYAQFRHHSLMIRTPLAAREAVLWRLEAGQYELVEHLEIDKDHKIALQQRLIHSHIYRLDYLPKDRKP